MAFRRSGVRFPSAPPAYQWLMTASAARHCAVMVGIIDAGTPRDVHELPPEPLCRAILSQHAWPQWLTRYAVPVNYPVAYAGAAKRAAGTG